MRFSKLAMLAAVVSVSPVFASSAEDITRAPDPSAAIQAYVSAPDRSSLEVEHAYVRRMEELGTPELADSQAKDVVARDPHDAIGWAAIAESNAKRGRMPEALSAIIKINDQNTDDPLVLAATGRLVAWYQNFGTTIQLDPAVKQRMDDLNHQLDGKAAFNDALAQAKTAYTNQATQQPGATAAQPVAPAAAPQPAPVAVQTPTPSQQPVYQPQSSAPIQNNPGPYGGTPVQPPPPLTSADVNLPPQREYVSGDTVYQGSPYSTYSGSATYGAPAYVAEPVYVPPPTDYYDYGPYYYGSAYYGPDIYIVGGRYYHRDWDRGHFVYHDFHHDFHDDHGGFHGDIHGGDIHGGFHDGGSHGFDGGHTSGGGGTSHGGGGGHH